MRRISVAPVIVAGLFYSLKLIRRK